MNHRSHAAALDITLRGVGGLINVTTTVPSACYRRADGVVTQYGVGTCSDPDLTAAEWLLRDQVETANNPFTRNR